MCVLLLFDLPPPVRSLGDVSVLSKGKCGSCGTEVDGPARELIREQYRNRFAPGNGTLAESVEGFT